MPRVSIITTVYNGAPYFDRVVPGILGQTFTDFEWVIVDDGSVDNTAELLADLARRDPRVRVLSPGRLGFVPALNYAINHCDGEFLARQDFDDRSYPDRLQLQVECMSQRPEVGLVGGYYVVVDENRGERYLRMPATEHTQIVRSMAKCIPFAHTLVMFRRTAWEQAGGYPLMEDIEDLRLWVTMAKMGWKVANIPHPLGEHFVHPNSFWHKAFKYRMRQRKLANVHWQAIRELHLPRWMVVYPLARRLYVFMPVWLKRLVRRRVAGSHEQDQIAEAVA